MSGEVTVTYAGSEYQVAPEPLHGFQLRDLFGIAGEDELFRRDGQDEFPIRAARLYTPVEGWQFVSRRREGW